MPEPADALESAGESAGAPAGDPADGASTPGTRPRRTRWLVWALAGVLAVVVLGFGAILIYANFINDPADELTVDDLEARLADDPPPDDPPADDPPDAPIVTNPPPTEPSVTSPPTLPESADDPTADDSGDLDGTWHATAASELGYRVAEVLFGVTTEGVGRTNQITGSLTIAGPQVIDASFEVDMASVDSDDSRRDGQFRGRIMSVVDHPTATFTLTGPIELGAVPAPGEQVSATATGDLTLRGVTNAVTFEVTAQHQDDRIGVLGTIPITFADYDIVNPSIAGITTEDHGLLEFVLVFER